MATKYKIKKFKVGKDLNGHKKLNEDRIHVINTNNKIKIILLDGASESFSSKKWSELLAVQFLYDFDYSLEQTKHNISKAIEKYIEIWDSKKLSWSQQAAFQRGSFSTLVVFECNKKSGDCKYLCIGDSSIFITKYYSLERSIPYDDYSKFSKHPYLVSTKKELNNFLDDFDFYKNFYGEFKLSNEYKYNILLMTDAISSWIMQGSDNKINRYKSICELIKKDDLSKLVERERTNGNLKVDDTSVVNISVTEN